MIDKMWLFKRSIQCVALLWLVFCVSTTLQRMDGEVIVQSSFPPQEFHFDFSSYPTSITHFPVRRDGEGQEVKRGQVYKMAQGPVRVNFDKSEEFPHPNYKLAEFQQVLQCASDEPDLNEFTGILNMLELMPPSLDTLHMMCAWAETRCSTWKECKDTAKKFSEGQYPERLYQFANPITSFRLLRIYKGEIYIDWPWGMERFVKLANAHEVKYLNAHHALMQTVLGYVSDIGDSFFFFGSERPFMPSNFPFPAFAFTSMEGFNHIIWPWLLEFEASVKAYRQLNPEGKLDVEMSDAQFDKAVGCLPWRRRNSTAAYYATYLGPRSVSLEFGRLFPDMFDVSIAFSDAYGKPWNPMYPDLFAPKTMTAEESEDYFEHDPVGSIRGLHKLQSLKGYTPGKYKYVIVPLAGDADSTSGRLLFLLAYSGSVILLPESTLRYHITARLVPWVHYVPYSYSGADLAEKVKWLQEHDDLAMQIAINGKNFGKSYLRLEDYLCYAARGLSEVSKVTGGSGATQPSINATKESGKRLRFAGIK